MDGPSPEVMAEYQRLEDEFFAASTPAEKDAAASRLKAYMEEHHLGEGGFLPTDAAGDPL